VKFKHHKKLKLKPKAVPWIDDALIINNNFAEIVNILSKKPVFTDHEQYLYGYALLRTQQKIEALITLWPLASKSQAALQEDCAAIAAYVFNDPNLLSTLPLSEVALTILLSAASNLAPQSSAYKIIKQRLYNLLWQQGNYEKLQHILKMGSEEFTGVLLGDLSKLAFLQAKQKFPGNLRAFVSLVLTGGACLIASTPIYHNDIADIINSLANEIKILFSQTKNKKNMSWGKTAFDSFVDYEANIIIRVLQLYVTSKAFKPAFIPSPSYLILHNSMSKPLSQDFLHWLATEDEELRQMYNVDLYFAAFWAQTGEKLTDLKAIAKTARQKSLHPYLRLALRMRAISIKKSFLQEIIAIDDFNIASNSILYKNLAILSVKSMLSENINDPALWQGVFMFYTVLQDLELENTLITRLIDSLHNQYTRKVNLTLDTIKDIASKMNNDDFKKQIDILHMRQQICAKFLLTVKNPKQSIKLANTIKDQQSLTEHITLIADACILLRAELSTELFLHIESLAANKKINALIPIKNFIDLDFSCRCAACQDLLYEEAISKIINKLNLATVSLPEPHLYLKSQAIKPLPTSSVLSQADPFKILTVSCDVTKAGIMQTVLQLIKQSPNKMAVIRQAQSALFNPAQRFLHHYLRYFDNENLNFTVQPTQDVTVPLEQIPLRQEFLNAK
jgi:hypothetical protein